MSEILLCGRTLLLKQGKIHGLHGKVVAMIDGEQQLNNKYQHQIIHLLGVCFGLLFSH